MHVLHGNDDQQLCIGRYFLSDLYGPFGNGTVNGSTDDGARKIDFGLIDARCSLCNGGFG